MEEIKYIVTNFKEACLIVTNLFKAIDITITRNILHDAKLKLECEIVTGIDKIEFVYGEEIRDKYHLANSVNLDLMCLELLKKRNVINFLMKQKIPRGTGYFLSVAYDQFYGYTGLTTWFDKNKINIDLVQFYEWLKEIQNTSHCSL